VNVVRKFIWEEDGSGNQGWLPLWIPRSASFDVSYSMRTMLHDILEHKLIDRGTLAEECEAFGRIVAGRGVSGYVRSGFQSPEKSLGAELGYACARVGDLGTVSKGTPNIKLMRGDDPQAVDFIRYMMPAVADAYRAEYLASTDEETLDEADETLLRADLRAAFNRMVLGARDARRRYHKWIGSIGPLFSQAEKTKLPVGYEGDILTVKVDLKESRIKMVHHDDERYPESFPPWMTWAGRIYRNS
jgi:hypothetical protein